jgi:4-amino-4-deoxy-L-arabinose transferase-like glycosyltransferase
MTVLSPTFLPSLNLMLDIPALALSLFALTLFLRATDRGSRGLSALAGFFAGLAMLTKYTAITVLPVMLLYALVFRAVRLGFIAGWIAALQFASWEGIVAFAYGNSHFLYHVRALGMLHLYKRVPRLVLPLVGLLGGLAPTIALLALVALGAPSWTILAAAAVGIMGYTLLALVPSHDAIFILDPATERTRLTLNNLVVGIPGLAFWSSLVAVGRRLVRSLSTGRGEVALLHPQPTAWFLFLWVGLEVLGYFALSPYPAVRRVMGVVIASTVLVGHLASGTCRSRARMLLVRGVLIGGILLGMAYYAVDLIEAMEEKAAADAAVRHVRERDAHGAIWYIGLWGFQFHAKRAGMQPAIPDRTLLRKGEWLVVPGERILRQNIHIDEQCAQITEQLRIVDALPLATKPTFYAGRTPIARHEGARVSVDVYRVKRDFVLASSR